MWPHANYINPFSIPIPNDLNNLNNINKLLDTNLILEVKIFLSRTELL